MPSYEITTEDNRRYVIETAEPVPEGPQGEALLRRALAQQLKWQQATSNTPSSLAEQVLGGVRDFGQQLLDTPAQIANTIGEYVSPDAPGGARRRLVPEVQSPQLPDVSAPVGGLEQGVRVGSNVASGLAASLLMPGVRERAARWLFGEPVAARGTPMLFTEPGRAVARGMPGYPAVPTVAVPAGALSQELSEGARNMARLLRIPDETAIIGRLSQQEAALIRGQLQRVAGGDLSLLEAGPLGELYGAIEQHLLSFR